MLTVSARCQLQGGSRDMDLALWKRRQRLLFFLGLFGQHFIPDLHHPLAPSCMHDLLSMAGNEDDKKRSWVVAPRANAAANGIRVLGLETPDDKAPGCPNNPRFHHHPAFPRQSRSHTTTPSATAETALPLHLYSFVSTNNPHRSNPHCSD